MKVLDVEDGALVVSPALDLASALQLTAGSDLYIEVQPHGIFLSRLDPRLLRQLAFAREGMARYRNTLRELAK